MSTVKVQYAKTHLSALRAAVEAGEEIIIARGDIEIAKLVPMSRPRRELGFLEISLPEDVFFEPLSEEELAQWETPL